LADQVHRPLPVHRPSYRELAGLVEVRLLHEGGAVAGASIRAPRALELGQEIDAGTIAACASLEAEDISLAHHRPVFASVGLFFAIAELRSVDCLARIRTNAMEFAAARERYRAGPVERFSLFVYARTSAGPERLRARMFAPLSNIGEDPATGSAAGALAGLLASMDSRADAEFSFALEQGVEMGRPSLINLSAARRGGAVVHVDVAGRCVPVMRGSVAV
jgi:trans-2,3-dihydro-3-hydroxyanthranilate isomerase